MSPNKSNPLDWMNEDPFFKKKLSLKSLEEQWKLDPSQIDGYVEKIIREATASTSSSLTEETSSLHFEHLDTHNYLITKIRIPSGIHPESIWAQINRTQIKLNGLGKDHSEIIPLPIPVNPDQSRGTYKQGSLQFRMPKMSAGKFRDIDIRYL
ncbi:Hsp20/alpha crystallin family protein [Paenibacillus sp. G2S3]|uniref:Hsp20/alpha crystallin family protein n=1 Tax=Paenibacillus sp. G2S3 TaxID=3047872 RepID=UPI0024C19DEE|nr:Hsp20/alpha crystallin family protein [Paenibacillus sp. G2S3]WHY17030.1 Hsp20/alpha crystallin family protein [Paenibacillus sp. G2S3]